MKMQRYLPSELGRDACSILLLSNRNAGLQPMTGFAG